MVLSTLHTNDAPQSLTRLANMGVAPFNIASSILLIMAQRLARRLCPHCKQPEDVPREALLEKDSPKRRSTRASRSTVPWLRALHQGLQGPGRYLPGDEGIRGDRTAHHGGRQRHAAAAQAQREGVADLRQSGLRKVKAGLTSLAEINRVTKD